MKLWSHNFRWVYESNFWLYCAMYALLIRLPLPLGGDQTDLLFWANLCFMVGLWLPGSFAAYLMDRFPRKAVYLWSLIGCLLCTFLIPSAGEASSLHLLQTATNYGTVFPLFFIRLIQGTCYGLALNLGNTLTIDITPSPRRSEANSTFLRGGRLGIGAAIAGVYVFCLWYGDQGLFYFSLSCCALAILSAVMLNITFRAPMSLPILSIDRYLLLRTWPEICNVLFLALTPGILTAPLLSQTAEYPGGMERALPWITGFIGFAFSFYLHRFRLEQSNYRFKTILSLSLLIASCLFIGWGVSYYYFLIGIFLLAMGTEMAATEFLMMFIRMSDHCQRGTATHSYIMAWETGFTAGIGIGFAIDENIGYAPLFSALIALILFITFTDKHYSKLRLR